MQKLQDSVFSIIKNSNLSTAVFSYLQPSKEFSDQTPHGGILKNTKQGWLALGPKFCVVDLRTGLKTAAYTFGGASGYASTSITSVIELPRPLTDNSRQLLICVQYEDTSSIFVFHVNGSQILRCIQTEVAITQLSVADEISEGPFSCFDGIIYAGTRSGEIFAFDLNRASLIQALKDITNGYENRILNESYPSNLTFLKLSSLHRIEKQRELALNNDYHLAILLNETSLIDDQYIFRNPDGTVRMKAKRDHIRVTVLQYIPQMASLAVGYNFGAFQIWNMMTLDLEFTSQVNVECLPVTHFGFQEPCDDPRAFCYLWVVFSVIDRYEEEEFPLAVMYSLTYQGKRMLSDTKYLYQDFSTAAIRFQVELSGSDGVPLLGGKCVSCHTYSVNSTLGAEGEDSKLNICQLVWECWGENANSASQYGMLLFDLDQWYKDQMPATSRLESNAFMSATWCTELAQATSVMLDVRLDPNSVSVYSHATRLEEHFYPNSLKYNCICLNTSEACILGTIGVQRQIISSLDEVGPTALLDPPILYNACVSAGLTPLYMDTYARNQSLEDQRRYLLSVALEARLSRFLKRCAHDWVTGSHTGAGCTLPFLVDWCWKRALDLKENARELTAPLFVSSAMPDRNVIRCLEHCVQQLTLLTNLLDSVLIKCCNLVVPDALSEIEEKYKGIGTVSMYFQVVQWFLRVGLLPEKNESYAALPYPSQQLYATYKKRRLKLNRIQDNLPSDDSGAKRPCPLLYIDQLIEHEFGGDRIHQMWINGGSECNGLYPPPSLFALLRLYLLPDITEEHKHSLVLYLLVDYSMVYDEVRYEAVIRRLMQFPTMFGLSNTAIKATQAFWHLDHRDFDFALDQLQCLTGNTLSEWQHNVVLSSLLAQKKTQAALQYLHVRKPNITHMLNEKESSRKDNYKLEDWQSCCNLYLARGLVFEALDVIRLCVENVGSHNDRVRVMEYFLKGCRNTGNLSKLLQVTLQPFEEDVFIKYLDNCNESQTSDILVMYYLQQNRYLEAKHYNSRLRQSKARPKDMSTSVESVLETMDRQEARDAIVDVACASLPQIANKVVTFTMHEKDIEPHVLAPKPMSVFVQARPPKNTFTYKSSFIQDTIENASETWINKPKMRKGLKRVLNIEETPFICTPKLSRTRSVFRADMMSSESTPRKRAKLDLSGSPKSPKVGVGVGGTFRASAELSMQMQSLLDMPQVQTPDFKVYSDRGGAETPHSILKTKRSGLFEREAPSPVDSRYMEESDDEMLETASCHTHYSDSTNKHLRFTIPTASESGSTPSPVAAPAPAQRRRSEKESERLADNEQDKDGNISPDNYYTSHSRSNTEPHPLESPPKKLAVEATAKSRKHFKDNVKARLSLSILSSSLSDDPNSSFESLADIPMTLIKPREKARNGNIFSSQSSLVTQNDIETRETNSRDSLSVKETEDSESIRAKEMDKSEIVVPRTPRSRRGIRASGESTPLINRSRSLTPERQESPIATPLPGRVNRSRSLTPDRQESPIATPLRGRVNRSRSRTPEVSPRSSPLEPIPELPKQEIESEPHAQRSILSVPRQLRSRSRTPDRAEKVVTESPRLEVITESPNTSPVKEPPTASPRRSLRSRSYTPEVEVIAQKTPVPMPRNLRSRSETPEKSMSPKKDQSARNKKPLSRLVLEANAFAKSKNIEEKHESDKIENTDSVLECTPMKSVKQVSSLMDVTLSPIVNKSVLQSSSDSVVSGAVSKDGGADETHSETDLKPLPAFATIHETYFEKSVLHSYQSSVVEMSNSEINKTEASEAEVTNDALKPLPAFTTINETYFEKSVLKSCESSIDETCGTEKVSKTESKVPKPFAEFSKMIDSDFEKSVLQSYQSDIESPHDSKEEKDLKHPRHEESSLITDDSDVIMKEGDQEEESENAAVIQKEKEKIVEIEREIHEIEVSMSDDSEHAESTSSDEEIIEGEEAEEEEESSSSEEDTGSASDEEIITIQDTDEELDQSVSDSDKLKIVVEDTKELTPQDNIALPSTSNSDAIIERNVIVHVEDEVNKCTIESKEPSNDNLKKDQTSLLTDDNSGVLTISINSLEQSDFNLNYSDEKMEEIKDAEKQDQAVETEPNPDIPVSVTVEETSKVAPTDITTANPQRDNPIDSPVETILVTNQPLIDDIDKNPNNEKDIDVTEAEKLEELNTFKTPKESYEDIKKVEVILTEDKITLTSDVIIADKATLEFTAEVSQADDTEYMKTDESEALRIMETEVLKTDDTKHLKADHTEVSERNDTVILKTDDRKHIKTNEIIGLNSNEAQALNTEDTNLLQTHDKEGFKEDETEVLKIDETEGLKIDDKEGFKKDETESLKIDEKDGLKIDERESLKIDEKDGLKIDETERLKIDDKEGFKKDETESLKIDEKDGLKIDETESLRMDETVGLKIDETESLRMDETEGLKIDEAENLKAIEIESSKINEREQLKTDTAELMKMDENQVIVSTENEAKVEQMDTDETASKDEKSISRKRSKSTSSNKSTDEIKTPVTRKRTQSNASNKSVTEEKTPESPKDVTPSRRRAKTPTSEVRRIITRRISKEMGEKLDDSISLDELTPKRRSSRSRTKNVDDNESVISESSVVSNKTKASEEGGDVKVRKARKSILTTKPDLSVIPEGTAEESETKGTSSSEVINEYSSSRRLTRNQKAVLETWLEPAPSPRTSRKMSAASRASRTSRTSRTSLASGQSHEDDDNSSTHSSAFDVQPIDRISLLSKQDFEGSPDEDEMRSLSPVSSIKSDEIKQRRSRLSRAASESKALSKAAKNPRRISVDIAVASEAGSPVRAGDRRASFTRACDALHTPKGRRSSADIRKGDMESPAGSSVSPEAEESPGRRSRRAPSTYSTRSNTSQTKTEAGKRSKKTLPDDKEDSHKK